MAQPAQQLDYAPDPVACERWISVPWYSCGVSTDWMVYATPCSMHPDGCEGHAYCADHLVTTMADPAKARDVYLVRKRDHH